MKKKLLAAIIFTATVSIPMFTGITAYADTISSNKAQQEQKAQAIQEKMEKLDNQIQNTMIQSQNLDGKIAKANQNISAFKTEIANTQAKLTANKQRMNEEIAGMYKDGFANDGLLAYINVLVSGQSFDKIITDFQDIYSIDKYNEAIVKKIENQENALKSDQANLENNIKTLENSKSAITSNLAEQQAAKKQEEGILSSVKNTIAQDSAAQIAAQKAEVQTDLKVDTQKSSGNAKAESNGSSSSASSSSSSSSSNAGGTMTVSTGHGNVSVSTAGNTAYVPNSSTATPQAQAVIAEAEKFLGVPYVWGGESPSGFDCSGLMQYVFGAEGVSLPRTAAAQQEMGTPVARGDLQPGDLVFWGDPAYHVAMYIGNGQIIAAPHTGAYVSIQNLWPYTNARRVL